MVKCLYECALSGAFTTTANVTSYMPVLGLPYPQTSTATAIEANTQYKVKVAGTLSNLYVNVRTNSISGSTTFKLRQNGVDTTILVTVGSSATGEFEDLTHTVNIAIGDLLGIKHTPGATTGTMDTPATNLIFDNNQNSSLTSTPLGITNGVGATGYTGASATYYAAIHGQLNVTGTITTESQVKMQFRKTGTWKNLAVKITANSRTTTTTIKSRKNAANGNQIITIGSTATGLFEDTTNSDSIAVNDQIDWTIVNGTGTSAITYTGIYSSFENTDYPGVTVYAAGSTNTSGSTLPSSTTNRSSPFGMSFWGNNAETAARSTIRNAFTLSDFSITVATNSFGSTITITLFKNAVASALTVSIGASSTGIFNDITHTVSIVSGDKIDYTSNSTPFSGSMVALAYSTFATTTVPLQSSSMSETAISVSDSLRIPVIPRTINEPAVIFGTFTTKVKVTRPITETAAITVAASSIVSKIIRRIIEAAITVGASTLTAIRKYTRTITEGSITASAATIVRKVIRKAIEPSITVSASSIQKKALKTITEPAKTIAATVKPKVTRVISEPAKSIADTLKKKASKTITEPAITASAATILRKVTRPITEPAKTVADTLTRFKKAIRSTSEPSINITETKALKITRRITESAKSIVDTLSVKSPNAVNINEPSVTVSPSSIVKKVIHYLTEPAKSISDSAIQKRAFKTITEPAKSIAAVIALKLKKTIAEPSKTISATLTRFKKAIRTISETSISVTATLTKTARNPRTISEPAINNILDNLILTKTIRRIVISESAITVNDTSLSRRAYFNRQITEFTPIRTNDIISTTKILFEEEHNFKLGLRFVPKITDDTNLILQEHKR